MRIRTLLTIMLWLILASPCPQIGAVDAGTASDDVKTEAKAVVKGISTLVVKCVDQQEPIDVVGLVQLINEAKRLSTKLDDVIRAQLIDDLGRILIYQRRIKIDWSGREIPGRRDPRTTMRHNIVGLFSELGDERALPYLKEYYQVCRAEELDVIYGPEGFSDTIASVIKKLGGEVPEVIIEKPGPTKAELEARRREVDKLIRTVQEEKPPDPELFKIIERLGELGDARAVGVIIKILNSTKVHWIVRQNGLCALGMLGGSEAQAFLVKELEKPMPANAVLDDYAEVEAICRSYAAKGLARCGDETVVALLERLKDDPKQYKRVREIGRRAALQITSRLSSTALSAVGGYREEKQATAVERLLSKDGQEINEAQNELLAARKDLIARLINIVKNNENRLKRQASVRAAMFILGEMRAVEAIGVLAEHIGFPYIREPGGEPRPGPPVGTGTLRLGLKGTQKTFPAVQALIKIGEPCLSDLISKLSSTDHMTEEKACLGVLVGLRQRDSVIEMLKDAIKKETNTKKKDRLQRGLDLLAQMKE